MFYEVYAQLVQKFPASCGYLYGRALAPNGNLWLSVDEHARPYLLFQAGPDKQNSDIELRSVAVEFSRQCEIALDEANTSAGCYTIIHLDNGDPDIIRTFLRLLEEAFYETERRYANKEIGEKILELADMFSEISESIGDVIGLWGELYVIESAKNVAAAAQCWCKHKNAKYDFVSDGFALEVKSTLAAKRKHRFSMEQLRPGSDFDVYVASLTLIDSHSGRTVSVLLDSLCQQIPDRELRNAFVTQCIAKGGSDIYRSNLRLGVLPNQKSLSLYRALDIPVPQVILTDPIDNVRFDVDLSSVSPLDTSQHALLLSFDRS